MAHLNFSLSLNGTIILLDIQVQLFLQLTALQELPTLS